MRTVVQQLIKVLAKEYSVMFLSIKWGVEEKQKLLHYNVALNPKIRVLFNPWHIPTIILYELSGAIWCLLLSMLGIRKFFVQEAIVGAFFATLVGKMTGGQVYVFDYGPMLDLHNPNFVKTPSKYRRGLLSVIHAMLLRVMNRVSVRHCTRFFVFRYEMKKLALDYGLDNEKIISYNFPIDTSVFVPYASHEREKIREKLGVKKDEHVITYVGRISIDKGLQYLLESAKTVIRKYGEQVRFMIAGDGPLVKWVLENSAEYHDRILFLGPLHDPREIVDLLNASDIFVYPITVSYGYALALLEAMATGLPGVITDIGLTKDLIIDKHNGMVIPTRNANALTLALEFLIENEELRKQMGENAKKVLTEFSTEAYRKTILNNIV